MTKTQWNIFCSFRDEFKSKIQEWEKCSKDLSQIQEKVAMEAGIPIYPIETPIVYNKSLDEISCEDDIKLIVIGDNPGKEEQLKKNNKYLIGQAGRIAEGFFKRNTQFGIDFRKNVIILNKTPIHSAKTNQLKKMCMLGSKEIESLLGETQLWMAKKTAELHQELLKNTNFEISETFPELWLVGYSELKNKGLFVDYAKELKESYNNQEDLWEKVYVFQHFSMNRFSIDLNDFIKNNRSEERLPKNPFEYLHQLGNLHKKEIFDNL